MHFTMSWFSVRVSSVVFLFSPGVQRFPTFIIFFRACDNLFTCVLTLHAWCHVEMFSVVLASVSIANLRIK